MVLRTDKIRNGIGKTGFGDCKRPAQSQFDTFRDLKYIINEFILAIL